MQRQHTFSRKDELSIHDTIRRKRSISKSIHYALNLPRVAGALYFAMAGVLFFIPGWWLPVLIAIPLIWLGLDLRRTLPLYMPITSKKVDYNDPKPDRKTFHKARGSFLLGNVMQSAEELYLNFSTLLQHLIVFGTTGAGKTETMIGYVVNMLAIGSGCIYTDAKAAPTLSWQLYTVARFFGRDDDFLTTNYLLESQTTIQPDPAQRISNDTAPFFSGTAEQCSQFIITFIGSDNDGPNKVFSSAAIALIQAVMPALTELRDKGHLILDPSVIRTYVEYANFCKLAEMPEISEESRAQMLSFIRSRAGYEERKKLSEQSSEVFRQFGFAQAYFIRTLSSLSDTYGHIYMSGMGEIDYTDVILNNRVVGNLLPSLQYSGEELNNLATMNLKAIQNALSMGLGSAIEGNKEEIIEALPTNSDRPFAIINDEYAYMAVKGFAMTAAQARGLNCALIFGAQDYAGLKVALKGEEEQIIANTRLKYIMALEDVESTFKLVETIASEAIVPISDGMESGVLSTIDNQRIRYDKIKRINSRQLRTQEQGEGFLFFKDQMIPTNSFWHGIDAREIIEDVRLGRKLKVNHLTKRSPVYPLLSFDHMLIRDELNILLNNADIAPRAEVAVPILFEDAVEACQHSADLIAHEYGLLFIGTVLQTLGFSRQEAQKPTATDSEETTKATTVIPSLLSNLSGNYEDDELVAQETINQILDDVANTQSQLTQINLIDTDTEEQANDADDDTHDMNFIMDETLRNSLFGSADAINEVAKGVATMVISEGVSEEQGKAMGAKVADSIMDVTEYPLEETPKKENANQGELETLLKNFLSGIDKK